MNNNELLTFIPFLVLFWFLYFYDCYDLLLAVHMILLKTPISLFVSYVRVLVGATFLCDRWFGAFVAFSTR